MSCGIINYNYNYNFKFLFPLPFVCGIYLLYVVIYLNMFQSNAVKYNFSKCSDIEG